MTNDLKWMLSSDQQFPYHDPRVIDLWFQVMKWYKPDVVDILGDTDDQFCYSTYAAGRPAEFIAAHKEFLKAEETEESTPLPPPILPLMQSDEGTKMSRDFYGQCKDTAKRGAELFTALGNHDIRVFNYVETKLPDYIDQVTPEALWGLDSMGWDYIYYDDLPKHRYGDIHVHHGFSVDTVGNSARKDALNFGVSIVRGHSHRAGLWQREYELRNQGQGELMRAWEIGHMCDEKSEGMKYADVHNWQKGFMIGTIESGVIRMPDGYYPHLQFIEVTKDYTCYVGNRKFSA
jgi:hypothetical protein